MRKHPALLKLVLLLLCLALLLPQASLAATKKKTAESPSVIRVLLQRLNLKEEAWMTLEGRYVARGVDGTEVLLPAGARITVLLRKGQLVLFHEGLSFAAGNSLPCCAGRTGILSPESVSIFMAAGIRATWNSPFRTGRSGRS